MPPPKKERFNAKARQSSHKKRKTVKRRPTADQGGNVDVNADIIDVEEQSRLAEIEQQRRELLARSADPSSADGPISSKKRKRLDAYIARQLKKERRQQLIADLAKSSAQVSDRSAMMRASTLGTGQARTGQDRLDQSEARQERQIKKKRERLGESVENIQFDEEDEDEDLDVGSDDEASEVFGSHERNTDEPADDVKGGENDEVDDDERQARIARARALFANAGSDAGSSKVAPSTGANALGSALALGPDGKPIAPIVRRKTKKKQARRSLGRKTAWGRAAPEENGEDDDDVSSEFDSSAESTAEDEDINQVGASDDEGPVSSDSDDDDDDDDDDELLREAMRRRGMIVDDDSNASSDDDAESDDEGSSENETTEGDEDEPPVQISSGSQRNGLGTTNLSKGFKEWAQSALGLPEYGEESQRLEDDVYRGPEPVAGLSVKVMDLTDGTMRGPLGTVEALAADQSDFAKRYYAEVSSLDEQTKKANNTTVRRTEELQEARLKLPILAEEDRITRTILENPITILCGETGSGKTTQVPQFLYEAGFGTLGSSNPGLIGVTQPRRVAALSMAARVGQELGLGPDRVSHQIRYDATVGPATNVKFMTDGVLLRELAVDFTLSKYSVIIIDEAHERSVNTDVLIGILSRVAKLRAKKWINGEKSKPLRLVIMSATLRVDDFASNTRLFDRPPPILQVEARQYPVVTHFNRRTSHDYVEEAIKKASKIHARLPNGGILIFLTGQAEIANVCKRLERRYGQAALEARKKKRTDARKAYQPHSRLDAAPVLDEQAERVTVSAREADVEVEDLDIMRTNEEESADFAEDVDDARAVEDDADALDTDASDDDDGEYDADLPDELRDNSDVPMHILPLYSLLPSDRQMQVFRPAPENARLVVVATNIAETSLTIPGITYVVDCGRSKERKYDSDNGIQSFEVGFISKASADQRAGRAGRTGPGHCYRLYSSNVYEEHFAQFAEPEILRMPVDNLVLMMKGMNIDNVANFPFPTPPDRQALLRAEKLLLRLGALSSAGKAGPTNSASQLKITELGRSMSLFPLNTRLSKLLVQSHQHGCLPYVVALVAVLTVGDPFIKEESLHESDEGGDDTMMDLSLESQYLTSEKQIAIEKRKAIRSSYFKALNRFAAISGAISDPLRLLSVVGAYEHAKGSVQFCLDNFLVPKLMEEVHKLRGQIASLVQANAAPTSDLSGLRSTTLKPPTSKQMSVLRQFLTSAFIDQIAIRADLAPESAARVPMLQQDDENGEQIASKQFYMQTKQGAKMQSTRNVAYLAAGIPGEACFVHKTSVLFHQRPPEWIVFSTVVRGRAKGDLLERKGRNWLKGVTIINPNWIYTLGPTLCSLSKPVDASTNEATRTKLIEAAQELLQRKKEGNGGDQTTAEKHVYLVPTYGTGPAFDASERSSYAGWQLPAFLAKQTLSKTGKWVTASAAAAATAST